MNSLANGTIIRQKAYVEKVCELESPVRLYNPREYNDTLYVCSHAGEILKVNDNGDCQSLVIVGGQPNCVALDDNDHLYFSDVANSVIYSINFSTTIENKNQFGLDVLMKDYEGIPLKGPTSLAVNNKEGRIFICDAGYFGSTSLNNPNGSLYLYETDTKITRTLLSNCLAYPADIIYDDLSQSAYLVETFTNRVIRIIQSPPDVFYSSIFHQFSGRIGPTAIAMDALGNIYVARYEFQTPEKDVDGIISVLNKDGYLVGEITLPLLPEITGMCIPSDKKADTLYFTEKSYNGVLKIKLSQFAAEIDKMLENIKYS